MEHKVVGIKEMTEFIKSLYKVFKQFWIVLFILIIVFCTTLGYIAYKTKPKYVAELSFMLNEDTGNSMNSALSAVLGKFSSGGGKYNLDKILELSKSRNITELLFFSKFKFNNEEDFISNLILKNYKSTVENSLGRKVEFFKSGKVEQFSLNEREQLLLLHRMMFDKNIIDASTNDKTGIMMLKIVTTNEELSKLIADTLYAKLGQFYIDKTVAKELQTYNIIKNRSEYLYGKVNKQMGSAVQLEDATLGTWQQTSKLPQIKYERDSRISTVLYGETLKNLELANFALQNKTPFVQLIDSPLIPLEKLQSNIKLQILIGLMVSLAVYLIICSLVLIAKRNVE